MLLQVYDWAIRVKEGKMYYRIITFYNLTQSLADTLKSLFCVLGAPYLVNNCAQLLVQCHLAKANLELEASLMHKLIYAILSTLSKCFLYDINGTFATTERLKVLMNPLIDQVCWKFPLS